MKAALFDLDRTLVDCNSGRLWLQAELRAGRVGLRDAARAAMALLRYHRGHVDLEEAYAWAVAQLAGQEEAELAARTASWFERRVRCRARPGALVAIAAHRAAGDALVLATSSSAYVAEAARVAWELDHALATVFEVHGGRFTGRIQASAFGASKRAVVERWAVERGISLAESTFYSDSVTDLALLEAVGRPVAVNPDPALARVARARGWEIADWGRSER